MAADAAQLLHHLRRLAVPPTADAGQTLPWLRDRPKPAPAVTIDRKRLEHLGAELDSDDFAVRDRAAREIEKFGEFAQPAFDKVLAGDPSAQVRSRIDKLAEKYAPAKTPERLRALRAIEVLQYISTAEARRLL